MHLYIEFLGREIPTYSVMILLGGITANLLALYFVKRDHLNLYDMIILEAYIVLGGALGAKGLFLWVNRDRIDWSRSFEPEYFDLLMKAGLVFYGGLIGGLFMVFLCKIIHHIEVERYVRTLCFSIPWVHAFGRVGCFMAGCCYGIPYSGPGAVVFPEDCYAPAGISLFPIQLLEAGCLMLLALFLLYLSIRGKYTYTLEVYLVLYAVLRFFLEELRYDSDRGYMGPFSTSQWICIILLILSAYLFWKQKRVQIETKNI